MTARFITDPHAMRDMAGRSEVHAQTAFKMLVAAALLATAGIITAMFGPGLAKASASPTEEQLVRISMRNVPETCNAVASVPTQQGVRGAIANVMNQTDLPKWAAGRVVGHSVRISCPQYLPLVQQVVPNFG